MRNRIIGLFLLCAVLLPVFGGCKTADSGQKKLTEVLYGQYTAEVHFVFAAENGNLEGDALIVKGERTLVEFRSPAALEGMTVESNAEDQSGNLLFQYYGMQIPLPQGALSKINLLLSVFSDTAATAAANLKNADFTSVASEGSADSRQGEPKSCSFTLDNGASVMLMFDPTSGEPLSFSAQLGECTATGSVTKFKRTLPAETP